MSLASPWVLVAAATVLVLGMGLVCRQMMRQAVARERAQADRLAQESREQVQQALLHCEHRMSELMEIVPVGVVFAGLDGTMTSVNAAFCEMVGFKADYLIGKQTIAFTHRDDRAEDRRLGASLVRGEIPSYTRIKRYEHSNGDSVFVRAHVRMLRGLDGKPAQLFGVVERMAARVEEPSEPASVPPTEEPVARVRPDGSKTAGTVLYIEDNDINVSVMRDLLEVRPGIRLEVATSAAAGMEALRTSRYDLVLLDWQLPDGDGLQVLLWMAVQDGPRPPVVVISANAMLDHIEAALDAGAAHYITKPLDAVALLGLVDKLLLPSS